MDRAVTQTLHILIVDTDRGEALATWHGSHWLLPILQTTERARAADVVRKWLSQLGLAGDVVGQWIGRAAPRSGGVDWLLVVRAAPSDNSARFANLRWAALGDLIG